MSGETRRRDGRNAESWVCEQLLQEGWTVRERNLRISRLGEIDIVAEKAGRLRIVEVRSRRAPFRFGYPEESLSKRKRDRLGRLAEAHVQAIAWAADWELLLAAVRMSSSGKPTSLRFLNVYP